ncbi:hydantoinase B/oxoprolinase family protein [Pseudenhygromyxa sp. WMMC2535]|uniref:hydantoinase B/oxoprolinase family protein n=1 Tax=Pseudenhygromyxa sp. WMMC2535 TaxID=2712867 RepID=UPI0015552E8C|nr:hydantoinase B/oxoprolinase family protein [Pseudenhygromyxa sp. WMMC2535]NVB39399.1 hydantoinase B/oxoprolinase family protein [Pseudenhygromyxa sp. WMMC2535]
MTARPEHAPGWEFWIDRGGTFTDIVARDPSGRLHTHKLLSNNPERYADAVVEGVRVLLGLAAHEPIPGDQLRGIKMGTTVATNALLERQGARVVLAITRGFADALRIGYQNRPRLFDREISLPTMLYEQVVEIDERVGAEGEVIRAIDREQVRAALAPAAAAGVEAVAIVLVHGWRFGAHERVVAEVARELGFTQVSVSHELSPLIKLVGRGDTTVVDAYLSPILRRYVERVSAALGAAPLQFMQSNGGLTDARSFRGKDAILSGPAGGIVGAAVTSAQAGFSRIVGFDMGGTSTDVTHYAGELERSFETEVAGVRVRAPMLEIHTVAAGGGSICRFADGRLQVGPESAGADPGPACYRRGGPLTLTDCNLLLGKLRPELFPRVFGPGGDQGLDLGAVHERFAALSQALDGRAPESIAAGFIEIAVVGMADAIKKISIERGRDLEDYALCCFGGAGGQHACLVADALGVRSVLIHPLAGVLSAYGMGLADVRAVRERSVGAGLDADALAASAATLDDLRAEVTAALREQGLEPTRVEARAHLRYAGSDRPLAVTWRGSDASAAAAMRADFEAEHGERYGFRLDAAAELTLDALEAEAVATSEAGALGIEALLGPEALGADAGSGGGQGSGAPELSVDVYMAGARRATPVFRRERLRPGAPALPGPAIIAERTGTTVVEPGWTARVLDTGHLLLCRGEGDTGEGDAGEGDASAGAAATASLSRPDPVRLEVFNNLYGSIAEQMGATLRNTAHSVNIKERLDFSCAVFDGDGQLIANAPHMPVHLGSMGAAVRAVIAGRRADGRGLLPGDAYVVNAPYNGGTHLPDVTVISPVFIASSEGASSPDFFVASRGHHADIGGISPGSMPAHSRHVDEEGVRFDDFLLVDAGALRREAVRARLLAGPWPARDPDQNLADLEAQLAANHKGAGELRRMVARWTLPVVRAYMGHVRANAAESVRAAIARLAAVHQGEDGEGLRRRFRYAMDEGSEVVVCVELDPETRSCRVDFSGTSAQRDNNFNAPLAVCQAAVLYVFRTLVDADIPMNEGCLDPIELVVPPGSMLDPRYPAAVVAGNVETSQVICDALYGALGVMAAAQGTMNNLTFGDERRQYYETVCGGAGAGPGFAGASAVHTHMTNSRLTDPEVLERRYPVRLESFEIRRGSGGAGQFRGGDGVRRALRFLEDMQLVLLANRREIPPFGAAGGSPGAPGRNWIERADGRVEVLGAAATVAVFAGDRFVLETPGGGGWGPPEDTAASARADEA